MSVLKPLYHNICNSLTSLSFSFTHDAYNFYIFPSPLNPDINFTCQTHCMIFLAKNGFDFNKVFSVGIPYIRESDKDILLSDLKEKHDKLIEQVSQSPSTKNNIPIPDENKATIDDILKRVALFLKSKDKTSLTLESHNSFVRRLIYQSVQDKFGSNVFLQTNKDYTMTVSVGLSKEEIKDMKKTKYLCEKQDLLDNVGFTNVIKLIIQSVSCRMIASCEQ